jgi:hypothetical protein
VSTEHNKALYALPSVEFNLKVTLMDIVDGSERENIMRGHVIVSSDKQINFQRNKILPVRLEVFTAVTIKNGVFWDVTPCGSCKNRRFGGI